MANNTIIKNAVANKVATDATWIGLATAGQSAGTAVTSEATGGSPAYARKQTTWGAASGGVVTGSAVTIDLAAGTYTHVLLCTASTGSTLYEWYALGTPIVMSQQGTANITPTFTES
jgi:hypothetical protein